MTERGIHKPFLSMAPVVAKHTDWKPLFYLIELTDRTMNL